MQFYVTFSPMVKSASYRGPGIDPDSRRECEQIMRRIYSENPSYWPYGLDMDQLDGGAYMIRKASDNSAVGFVGWQERFDEDGAKVGYYSIGVLPEHRGHGLAKEAIQNLIRIKAAGVDRVRALIMKDNNPSKALAKSLGVPVALL